MSSVSGCPKKIRRNVEAVFESLESRFDYKEETFGLDVFNFFIDYDSTNPHIFFSSYSIAMAIFSVKLKDSKAVGTLEFYSSRFEVILYTAIGLVGIPFTLLSGGR